MRCPMISLCVALAMFSTGSVAKEKDKKSFSVNSTVVTGSQETGFYSKIVSDGRISDIYSAKDGEPANPRSFPFNWENVPKGTKSIAIVFDDPDAKPVMEQFKVNGASWIHWVAANINPDKSGLADNASQTDTSFIQGKNTSGKIGYMGPQPPSSIPESASKPIIHIYRLVVYALKTPLDLKSEFTIEEFRGAIKGKVLGEATLNMSYSNMP